MANAIGIDLGTTNVLVYEFNRGVILNEPACLAIRKSSMQVEAVGQEAYRLLGREPEDIEVVYPLSGGVISSYTYTEKLLVMFLERLKLGAKFWRPDILICCPTNISAVEQRALIEAAQQAGGKTIYLEEEPKVAAIGAGFDIFQAKGMMVMDIGGGTCDVAVLSLGSVVSSRSVRQAGLAMNQAIITLIDEAYHVRIGPSTAEKIKLALATAQPLAEADNKQMEVRGIDCQTGYPRAVKVTANEINQAIRGILVEMCHTVRDCLETTPPELTSDVIKRGLFITGGGALIPHLQDYLVEQLGIRVHLDDHPLESVVLGTGKLLKDFRSRQSLGQRLVNFFKSHKVIINPTVNLRLDKTQKSFLEDRTQRVDSDLAHIKELPNPRQFDQGGDTQEMVTHEILANHQQKVIAERLAVTYDESSVVYTDDFDWNKLNLSKSFEENLGIREVEVLPKAADLPEEARQEGSQVDEA